MQNSVALLLHTYVYLVLTELVIRAYDITCNSELAKRVSHQKRLSRNRFFGTDSRSWSGVTKCSA
jgi:hypothetical protein